MDLKPIRDVVRKRVSALYKERFPIKGQPPVDIECFDERIARWKLFLTNTNSFETHQEKVRYRQARRAKLRDRARQIVAEPDNYTLCAIDIIPTPDETNITSIGMATLRFGHSLECIHIDIAGVREEPCDFEHGDRITMPLVDAMAVLRQRVTEADFVVGHVVANDFRFIINLGNETIPARRVLDTSQFHAFLKGGYGHDTPKLGDLVKQYGLVPLDMSVAGNHAVSSIGLIQTMLKMAS